MVFLVVGGVLLAGGVAIGVLRRPISAWLGDALPMGFPDGWVSQPKVGFGGAGLAVAGAFSILTGVLQALTR